MTTRAVLGHTDTDSLEDACFIYIHENGSPDVANRWLYHYAHWYFDTERGIDFDRFLEFFIYACEGGWSRLFYCDLRLEPRWTNFSSSKDIHKTHEKWAPRIFNRWPDDGPGLFGLKDIPFKVHDIEWVYLIDKNKNLVTYYYYTSNRGYPSFVPKRFQSSLITPVYGEKARYFDIGDGLSVPDAYLIEVARFDLNGGPLDYDSIHELVKVKQNGRNRVPKSEWEIIHNNSDEKVDTPPLSIWNLYIALESQMETQIQYLDRSRLGIKWVLKWRHLGRLSNAFYDKDYERIVWYAKYFPVNVPVLPLNNIRLKRLTTKRDIFDM